MVGQASGQVTRVSLPSALSKRALWRSFVTGFVAKLDYEAQLQGLAGRTTDHREGLEAFVEKRAPRFTGS